MSVLTAIFQALAQAVAWVLPISESGHSAIFHDFSGRYTDACSQLTGIIHIGIAIGLFVAFFKLFVNLGRNFFMAWNDLFHKRFKINRVSPLRKFMFMTVVSFVFFIFYLLPAGKYGNVYSLFHHTAYNGNLVGEGICIALTGVLLIAATSLFSRGLKKMPEPVIALVLGIVAFFAVPTAGSSLVAGVFAAALLMGMSDKYALRYAMVLSVPVLIVTGIIEICLGVTKIGVIQAVLGLTVSAAAAFLAVKVLVYIIHNRKLHYIAFYDLATGLLCFVIGIFEIVIK